MLTVTRKIGIGRDQTGLGRPKGTWSTKTDLVDQMGIGRSNSKSIHNGNWSTKSELVDQIRFGQPNPIWSTKSELVAPRKDNELEL